jgi:hypothetical protein
VLHSFLGWHPDGNVQLERHLGRERGGGVNLAGGGGCVGSFLIYVAKPSLKCLLEFATYWMWWLHDADLIECTFCPQTDMGILSWGLQGLGKQYEGL